MLYIFDVNETLLDVADLDDFVDATGTADARREWFDLVIHTAITVTATGGYREFGAIAVDCLPVIAARHGHTVTDGQVRELVTRFGELPTHSDVPEALDRLRATGADVVTLTNSTAEVAQRQLRSSGLRDLVDAAYSADEVHRLKPAPEPYRHVLARQRIQPSDATLIAAHDWDIAGAAAAGLRTAFVSRDGRAALPGDRVPGAFASSLTELVERIG